MTTIVTTGGADRAPAIRLTTGHELEWSGKTNRRANWFLQFTY